MQLSAVFSRFLGRFSVALNPYPSECLKSSLKPYELPRDSYEADINQIVTTRTSRTKKKKCTRLVIKTMSLQQRKKVNRITNLGSRSIIFDILQKQKTSSQANWTEI
jgi:hypothetical protein